MTGLLSMTMSVSADTMEKLDRLADKTRRDRQDLVAEALRGFVDHELRTIAGIERGLADKAAGRVVPHRAAMDEVNALLTGPGRPRRA